MVFCALNDALAERPIPSLTVLTEIERITGRIPDLVFARAEIEAWAGDKTRAEKIRKDGGVRSTHFANATLAASVGAMGAAMSELELALEYRELSSVWIRTDPRFDGIRHIGKFKSLIDKLPSAG